MRLMKSSWVGFSSSIGAIIPILLLMNHETQRVDRLRVKTLGEPGVLIHVGPILWASFKKEESEKLAALRS